MLRQLRSTKSLLILLLFVSLVLFGFVQPGFTNTAPQASAPIPDQTGNVNENTTVNLANYFRDTDGDTLTYTASSSATTKASVSVSGSTLTITGVAGGTATITATATDPGGLSATQTFSVTVNGAPTTVGSIPAQAILVDGSAATVDVSGYFSDPDGDTLTYTAASSDTSKATVSVSSATVTITPVALGTATVTVTASDGSLSAAQTISVSVVDNLAPITVGSMSDQTLDVGGGMATNVDSYFSDSTGDTLTYTASSSDTAVATASMSGFRLTVLAVGAGTATISVTATDPGNLSATQSFTVTGVVQSPGSADVLPAISSEERAQIADSLAMDRVIFNELRNASTDMHDWVELRNISTADVNLDDWQLLIVTSDATLGISFPVGAVLPAGELLLLTNTDPNAPDMPLADTGRCLFTMSLMKD